MRCRPRVLLAAAVLLLPAGAVSAITQYGHKAWRVQEGYFTGAPSAVAQTRDGYLWIGTEAGLFRFDGVQFERWSFSGTTIPSERIVALLGTRDGSLWIGSAKGLFQWKDGRLVVHASAGRFGALVEDRAGTVWAGHTRSLEVLPPLCRMERGVFRCMAAPGNLKYISAIHEDSHGDLWLGGGGGVCRWRPAGPECHPIPDLVPLVDKVGVFTLGDAGGDLYAGAVSAGTWRLAAGKWERFEVPPDGRLESQAMLSDRTGGFWVAAINRGVIRRIDGRTEIFTQADGLSSDNVNDLFEDREGNVWVATSAGLDRFRTMKVATFTKREGLPTGVISAVAASREGGVWIADRNALVRRKDEHLAIGPANGLPVGGTTSLFEDSRGQLWFGVQNGLARLEGTQASSITMPDRSSVGVVIAIAEDRTGDVWVATTRSLLVHLRNGSVVETFSSGRRPFLTLLADPAGGMWAGMANGPTGDLQLYREGAVVSSIPIPAELRSLFLDSRGLWAVTNQGLRRHARGRVDVLGTENGLPCNDIESALEGDDGALWLKTSCGLVRIANEELAAWSADPRKRVQVRVLDAFDGVRAGLTPFTPRSAKSTDGRLWFAIEGGGLQVLDPKHIPRNAVPPPAYVLRVVADGKTYAPRGALRFPSLTKGLQIDYTALSFSVPEKVRFRYRLEGTDAGWQDVGTRRQAFYSNLDPGSYRFRVIACNDDGVWNEADASVAFVIPPAFHQTRIFLALCIAAAAALVWLVYRWRVNYVRGRLEHAFEERLAERTAIAREIHDTLMQGLVSSSMQLHVVIDELPADSPQRGKVQRVQDLMRRVIEEGRVVLRGLRSRAHEPDDLEQVLARVPAELDIRDAAGLRVVVDGDARPLRPVVREEVHRIAREALVNAFRHARARNIEVELEYGTRELRVVIRDDGAGIDADVLRAGREDHWGLSGMRERAERIGAKLTVWSRAETGTEVELTIANALAFEN